MEQLDLLRGDLLAIMTASRLLVKRLRRREAHMLAMTMEHINGRAVSLYNRRDLLLPIYRREVASLQYNFAFECQKAEEYYPGVTTSRPKKLLESGNVLPPPPPTKSLTVHITLPTDEWTVIDQYITGGHARSRADYFRWLHFKNTQ